MPLALLFPGQASQEVGMGVELRRVSDRADRLFRLADEMTRLPIGELCAKGPLDDLTRTHVAQTAVVVTSLAAALVLEEIAGCRPPAVAVAGHSVGELTAYCWAGAIDETTALQLVHERGRLMELESAASEGTMVAVLGLDAEILEEVCTVASERSGHWVAVANLNAPGQVVLSGHRAAIAAASELATERGARRVLPLNVGGPFHSRYMEPAARDFAAAVERAQIVDAAVPIVLNTTTTPETQASVLRAELPRQMTASVRWEESVRTLQAMGCDSFVELGPGQVLSGLVRRTLSTATIAAAGSPDGLRDAAKLFRCDGA